MPIFPGPRLVAPGSGAGSEPADEGLIVFWYDRFYWLVLNRFNHIMHRLQQCFPDNDLQY